MGQVRYKTSSPLVDIPEDITEIKDIDFYISLFKRLKHDREKVDLECLYEAYLQYHDYEPSYKTYNLEKACRRYADFTNNKRILIRHERRHEQFMRRVNESKKHFNTERI